MSQDDLNKIQTAFQHHQGDIGVRSYRAMIATLGDDHKGSRY